MTKLNLPPEWELEINDTLTGSRTLTLPLQESWLSSNGEIEYETDTSTIHMKLGCTEAEAACVMAAALVMHEVAEFSNSLWEPHHSKDQELPMLCHDLLRVVRKWTKKFPAQDI